MTVSWEYQQQWHKSSKFRERSQHSLSSSFFLSLFTQLPESPPVLSLALFFDIRCLIGAILIAFSFFKCLSIWNMSSPLLMRHGPYQAHSLDLIWSILKVYTLSDLHDFRRRFPVFLLTHMTCSIFLSIFDASMKCSFANYKLRIAIKMTFFLRKGIVAQRTWSRAIPHVIMCYLLYKMKKQYCRTKQMGWYIIGEKHGL